MRSLLAVLMVLLAAPDGAVAQVRNGFWAEASAGTGTVRNTCAGCPDVTVGFGSSYHARAGGALHPRVLLGIEAFVLNASDFRVGPGGSPVDARHVSVAPVVLWYVGNSGFYLKAGAGIAWGLFSAGSAGPVTVTHHATGGGVTFGIGFDLGVVDWLAINGDFGTHVTAIGDVVVDDMLIDDIISTIYEASVGITLR